MNPFDELHAPMDGDATGRLRGLVRRFMAESYVPVSAVECKATYVRRKRIGTS